jgi:hypothetical protein
MNSLTWHDFAYVFWPVIISRWGVWPLVVAGVVLLADHHWHPPR